MSLLPVGIGSEEGGYQIERSLRFNSADSAYLNKTFASAGNKKTFTISMWVKRSSLSASNRRLLSGSGGNFHFRFTSAHQLSTNFQSSGTNYVLTSTQVFRDTSAYYHFVAAYDTTQATSSNRIKFYVNGEQITAFGTANYPPQNAESEINAAAAHYLFSYDGSSEFFDGYATEINFIDGQALTPSSFGEFNTDTGVWQPIEYTGTYGTNGFYLPFSDNASTTTLGDDFSGNGNDWTTNNFSVTAGAGNDSLVDSPTRYGTDTGAGGEVRGNYATLNPLASGSTLSNGNLDFTTPGVGSSVAVATFEIPKTSKWYFEVTVASTTGTIGDNSRIGIQATNSVTPSKDVRYYSNGNKSVDASVTAYGASYAATDVIGIAVDSDANTVEFYKNGSSQGSISYTMDSSLTYFPVITEASNTIGITFNANFGQRPFASTAPAGFKALVTTNLP